MKRKRREEEEEAVSSPPPSDPFPFNELPVELAKLIFSFVVPKGMDSLRLVIRMVCKRWDELAAVEKYSHKSLAKNARRRAGLIEIDALVLKRLDLLEPALLLFDAAELGHVPLCELAERWFAKDYERAGEQLSVLKEDYESARDTLYVFNDTHYAAGRSQRNRARDPLRKVRSFNPPRACLRRALFLAAELGRLDVCVHLRRCNGYDSEIENVVLEVAAERGHSKVCEMFCTRGNANAMLIGGARGGHVLICNRAIQKKADAWKNALRESALRGKEETFRYLLSFSETDNIEDGSLNDWTQKAAQSGYEEICVLIYERADEMGAFGFLVAEKMLVGAAKGGHEGLCRKAKMMGAVAFGNMALEASDAEHPELADLAQVWLLERG